MTATVVYCDFVNPIDVNDSKVIVVRLDRVNARLTTPMIQLDSHA